MAAVRNSRAQRNDWRGANMWRLGVSQPGSREQRGEPLTRSLTLLTLAVIAGGLLAMSVATKPASAWTASWSGDRTLVAYNWNTYAWAWIPYWASSEVYYVQVWDYTGYYTRVDSLTHQTKTYSNMTGWDNNLFASATTTMYSGGVYMTSETNLGGCWIPAWIRWFCSSSGSPLGMRFYGAGSANIVGYLWVTGAGWGVYSGGSVSGWYYWS